MGFDNLNYNFLEMAKKMKPEYLALKKAVQNNEIRYFYRMGWASQVGPGGTDATLRDGKKYVKLDVGSSGRFMIEKSTDLVFGIKAYGVIHRGHRFGTVKEFIHRLLIATNPLRY